tara:strand:- start:17131 stop:19059 length:1929 start_codon:yes stop_codon:yes gene_type:complete
MEPLRNQKVEEQFGKLIKNFISRNENYDMSRFIGGMPITLEKTDMSNLTIKNKNGDLRYTVTQKVDGTRYLMYIGPDTGLSNIKQRTVCFVDRDMKLNVFKNFNLPDVNTPEMLLDGEIVYFDANGKSHRELDPVKIKGISFMVFDILFGPEEISVDSDGNKKIGQSFSMTVPQDGKLRSKPWYYINRYDILSKLIVPNMQFNKNEPILPNAFKGSEKFNIELKPIYFLGTLLSAALPLYNLSGSGWLQTELKDNRSKYYSYLSTIKKKTDIFTKKLELDGLIFTSADTLYTIGTWNNNLTGQYKWKPPMEQTVDLKIKKVTETTANVLVKKGSQLEYFQERGQALIVNVPNETKTDTIHEFSVVTNSFKYKNSREDKTLPNAINTVLNVIRSYKNPVNIDNIVYFLKPDNEKAYKVILEHSSRTKLFKCVSALESVKLIEESDKNKLTDMIKNTGTSKELEIEMRLGLINRGPKTFFDPIISRGNFEKIIIRTERFGFKKTIDDFVDIYDNGVRTRYIYSKDFGRFIQYESVIKSRISNIDIPMSNTLNFDTRFSMSKETPVMKYNTEGDTKRKYRISYTEPNELFRIDFTAITNGSYSLNDRLFKTNKDPNEKFQIEIEFISDKINIEEYFKFLTHLLSI